MDTPPRPKSPNVEITNMTQDNQPDAFGMSASHNEQCEGSETLAQDDWGLIIKQMDEMLAFSKCSFRIRSMTRDLTRMTFDVP